MKTIVVGLALTIWTTLALAQNEAARQNAGDRFFPGLARVMTDAQRESLRTVLASQYSQIQPLERQLRSSRQALLSEITSGSFNEANARQDAQVSANAEVELTVIYARALSQMSPPLSAAQIQQMKSFQPGQFQREGDGAQEGVSTPPASHLPLPPDLPRDSNGLPVVN
jgi:Spy/CpxP family protein refolding chaperone